MSTLIQPFINCYQQLNKNNLESIAGIYHPDIRFQDPSIQLEGLAQLQLYFQQLYENIDSCQFDVTAQNICGNQAYVHWTMCCQHKKLSKPMQVEGISHLTYQQEKIIAHRDYFDLGALVYEQLPVLGRFIRKLKQGLAPKALRGDHD
jgi:ketosteroid isomerase-like protein